MADNNQHWIKAGLVNSIRNQRMINRSMLHGVTTMQSASAAFAMFEGASPDYRNVSGFLTVHGGTTKYSNFVKGPVAAFAVIDQSNSNASGSVLLYENGAKHQGPVPPGTVLLDPRAIAGRTSSSPTAFIGGTTFFGFKRGYAAASSAEPTYTVSGDITVAIQSGQIQNFVF